MPFSASRSATKALEKEEKETHGRCATLTHSRRNRQDQQQAAHDYHLIWSMVEESQTSIPEGQNLIG